MRQRIIIIVLLSAMLAPTTLGQSSGASYATTQSVVAGEVGTRTSDYSIRRNLIRRPR